jgi:hypothetical protein
MLLGIGLVSAVVIAGALALVAGYLADQYGRAPNNAAIGVLGISAGVILAAVRAVATGLSASREPLWPDFAAAGASVPVISGALSPFVSFITLLFVLSLLFEIVANVTRRWTRRRITGVVLFFVMGLLLESHTLETIPSWLGGGALLGATLVALYISVLRYQPRAILPMVATLSGLSVLREAFHRAYPGAVVGGVLAVVIIAAAVSMMVSRQSVSRT